MKLLEALKTIKIKCHPKSGLSPLVDEALDVVEQALFKAQKEREALEIIKKKWVDVGLIRGVFSVESYNQIYACNHIFSPKWLLTEEEFKLLKEVLG